MRSSFTVALMAPLALALPVSEAEASSARWAYEDGYDNVFGGDWYRDYNDDYAPYLNGSESYVMLSLANMYRTTGDPGYLERLVWHADGVLAQRNDARGVTDFTGEATPCWRDMYYSGGRPFCWVLHSGMIIEPMIEFARLVARDGLGDELAYDGLSFAEKAETYVSAAKETVAYHDVEWHEMGTYIVRADATFLGAEAGAPYPLNCSNAMGRALLLLYDVTGDVTYLDKATALAEYFYNNLVLMSWGGYAWPYYGDDILDNGEDISHGALNVRFAVMAWERGIVFSDEDMDRFVNTLLDSIAIDDRAFHNNLNGGGAFQYDYDAQLYNWLPLAERDPRVYTTVYNVLSRSYPAADTSSGSVLEGWSLLAEHALPWCAPTLPAGDWKDPDASADDDWDSARKTAPELRFTASGAPCMAPVELDSEGALDAEVRGAAIARWQATDGALVRALPVPAGVGAVTLASEGGALRVREHAPWVAPTIHADASLPGHVGEPVAFAPLADGDPTLWWSMSRFATGARMDPASGSIDWTPAEPGLYSLTVRADNDAGADEAALVLCIDVDCPADTGGADTGDTGGTADSADTGDTADSAASEPAETASPDSARPDTCAPAATPDGAEPGGCGCGAGGRGGALAWGLAAVALLRRRRGLVLVGLMGCAAPAAPADTGAAACPPVVESGDSSRGDAHTGAPDSGAEADSAAVADTADSAGPTDTQDVEDTGDVVRPSAVALTAGVAHTCALLSDGAVLCWGSDSDDKLAAPAEAFVQINAGYYHTCGVTTEGAARCWGEDSYGRTTPPAVPMTAAAGAYLHSAGILVTGELGVWGVGGYALNTEPAGTDYVSLDCGQFHCCALDSAGTATCWGQAAYGATAPPSETFTTLDVGALHACGLNAEGEAFCWGYDGFGETVPPEGERYSAVACGHTHCCGLLGDGRASCWGSDAADQCDPPDQEFVALTAGAYHTCGLRADGSVACWGSDAQGQADVPVGLAVAAP